MKVRESSAVHEFQIASALPGVTYTKGEIRMKRFFWLLIVVVLLSGCASVNQRGFNTRTSIHTVTNTAYDATGFDIDGYNKDGWDKDGFNRRGYDKDWFDRDGYDNNGFNRSGYNRSGFNKSGYNVNGYNEAGFNKDGWNENGYDKDGFNKEGVNALGWYKSGINSITQNKYDKDGYDITGFNAAGYNKEGYNRDGYDKDGYDKNKWDKEGINKLTKTVFDRYGYDREGFNSQSVHRDTGTKFDKSGYNVLKEKGYKIFLAKGTSPYKFDIGTIKIDGQPFAMYESAMVSKGRHIIEAQSNNYNGYNTAINIKNHSQAIDINSDVTVNIDDYGITWK